MADAASSGAHDNTREAAMAQGAGHDAADVPARNEVAQRETRTPGEEEGAGGGRRLRYLQIGLGLLFLIHLVQVFSPMRLDLDATSYLSRTIEIVDGEPLGPTWLPPGYSYMLAGLELLGIGNAWTFAGLNLLFVSLGIACSYYVLRRELRHTKETALLICCMTLLSFVFIKYMPMPLGDTAYFGLSMAVIALLSRVREGGGPAVWLLLSALMVGVIAILTRTIGITLAAGLIGLIWYQARERRRKGILASRSNRVWLVSVLATILFFVGAIVFFLTSRYLAEVFEVWTVLGTQETVLHIFTERVKNWGELFLNVPRSVAPERLHFLYPPAAFVALVVVLVGFIKNHRHWGPAEAYFAAYFLALLIYPGHQTRYWLPVVPLMIGWGAVSLRSISVRPGRWARIAMVALYLLTGAAALGYSTRITFSGHEVARIYGDGSLSEAYEAAYRLDRGQTWPSFDSRIQDWVFILLRRYDPRVREEAEATLSE